jgi:hypothetical protein
MLETPSSRKVLCGVAVGICLLLVASYFSNQLGEICEYNRATHQNDCPSYNFAFFLLIESAKIANDFGPAILAIATIVIASLTITLAKVAHQQITDTRILQRAYISAEPAGISPFLPRDLKAVPTDKTLVGHADFRNAGRLPAQNVQWYMDAECSTDPNYKPDRFGPLTGNNVIAPGEAMTQGSIEQDIPKDRLGYFYVWGKIVYDDGFVRGRETIFCHRYNFRRLKPGKDGLLRIRRRYGRHHDRGNDAT